MFKVKLGKPMYAILYVYFDNSIRLLGGWPPVLNEKQINE